MKAAVIQTRASTNCGLNLERVGRQLEEAAAMKAKLVVLPEYFAFLRSRGNDPIPAEPLKGPTFQYLSQQARRLNIWLVGGSFYQKTDGPKAYNTSLLIDNQGRLVDYYQKIHLATANPGAQNAFDESRYLKFGRRQWVRSTVIGNLGLAICYDLRFPEVTRSLRLKGAQVVAAPSSFFIAAGKSQWHALIRARAIENQCYMLVAGQWGEYAPNRQAFGFSMIIGPNGETLAESGDEACVLCADISLKKVEESRGVMDYLAQSRMTPKTIPIRRAD